MASLNLYYHTIRHLKWQQVTGQIRHRIRRRFETPKKFREQTVPDYPGTRFKGDLEFLSTIQPGINVDNVLSGRFEFLNAEHEIGWPPDWRFTGASRLWQYQLHYFDCLRHLPFDHSRELVLDWIRNHPLDRNMTGWESYPISVRLMNWIGVFWGKYRNATEGDADFLSTIWRSINLQAEWLSSHLETHLMGNHLLENAAALTIAGSVFKGDAAAKWLHTGLEILHREIPEQMRSDGMHFEASPMYHGRVIFIMLYLYAVCDEDLKKWIASYIYKAIKALKDLCHPDGEIALLNDSAFKMVVDTAALVQQCDLRFPELAAKPSMGVFALPTVGYYGCHDTGGNTIICDAGPIGPDYIPGHAHGDIFSFELSLRGCRVIVDSGVHDYESGEMRRYCRSTKAHNTVEINGEDQCRFWGAFRVAQRGKPYDVEWTPDDTGFVLRGKHDEYRRLPGSPIHSREFRWRHPGTLTIKDHIQSKKPVTSVARIHLHPDCRIVEMTAHEVIIEFPAGRFKISFSGEGRVKTEDSMYCPEFGVKIDNIALAYETAGSDVEMRFEIGKVE